MYTSGLASRWVLDWKKVTVLDKTKLEQLKNGQNTVNLVKGKWEKDNASRITYVRFVCWFACFVLRPSGEYFTHMLKSLLLVKGLYIHICSEVMTIEQWKFFKVTHLLWHQSSPRTQVRKREKGKCCQLKTSSKRNAKTKTKNLKSKKEG